MKKTTSPYIPGTISLAVVMLLGSSLLAWQFYWLYGDELENKGLSMALRLRLCSTMGMSLLPLIIPAAAFAFGFFAGRKYFREQGSPPKFLRTVLLSFVVVSAAAFCYTAFRAPMMNIKALGMLYSIRMAQNEQEVITNLNDTARSSFFTENTKNYPAMCTLPQLISNRKQILAEQDPRRKRTIEALKETCNHATLTLLLDSSKAEQFGITTADIAEASHTLDNPGSVADARMMLQLYKIQKLADDELIVKYDTLIAKDIFYPFVVLLLTFAGVVIGYPFRRLNIFAVIAIFYFLLCAIPYLLDQIVTMLIKYGLSPYWAEVLHCLVLLVPLPFLLRLNRRIKKESFISLPHGT